MADWQLSVANGTLTSLDELNVGVSNIQYVSLAPDTMSLVVYDAVDSTGWSYGDSVLLRKDSTNWFQGVITKVPRFASGEEENISYEVSGPWWYLDNICYKQLTGTRPDGSDIADQAVLQYTPTCILGQREDGSYINTSEQIEDILTYATDGSLGNAPFSIGSVFSGIDFPTSSIVSTTCADAIRQLVRYHPDVVSYFDYSGSSPVLNFTKRSGLTPVSVDLEGAESVSINSRDDLVPSYVEVVYEITGSVNGEAFKDFSVDKAGSGPEVGALTAVVNLKGDKVQIQRQRLRTRDLPPPIKIWGDTGEVTLTNEPIIGWIPNPDWGVENDQKAAWRASVKQFWKEHVKWIEQVPDEDWRVRYDSHGMRMANFTGDVLRDEDDNPLPDELQDQEVTELYTVNPISQEASLTLPRELIAGSITPWMKGITAEEEEEGEIPQVQEGLVIVRAQLIYDGPAVNSAGVKHYFPNLVKDAEEGKSVRYVDVEVRVRATDGITKIYQNLQGIEQAETVPEGVAQAVMDSLSSLQYEGSVTQVGEEVENTIQMGDVVNIDNGRSEWTSMNATVQSISQDIYSGTTTANFGPPTQLSPQTYADLLRFIRANPVTYVSERERTEGKVGNALSASESGYKHTTHEVKIPPQVAAHPFEVTVDVEGGVTTANVHPGFVWVDQINNTAPKPDENYGVDKLWPTLGGTALNAIPAPSQTITNETVCQLKISVVLASRKVSSAIVEFAVAAGVDSQSGGFATMYRTIATIDHTTSPPAVTNEIFDSLYFPTGTTGEIYLDWDQPSGYDGTLSPSTNVQDPTQIKYENGHWITPTPSGVDSIDRTIFDLTDYEEVELNYDIVTFETSAEDTTNCTLIKVTPWRSFVLARKSNTTVDPDKSVLTYESMDCPTWVMLEYVKALDIVESSGECTAITVELAQHPIIEKDAAGEAAASTNAASHTAVGDPVYFEPCTGTPGPAP